MKKKILHTILRKRDGSGQRQSINCPEIILYKAIVRGSDLSASVMIATSPEVNVQEPERGWSPLDVAVTTRSSEITKLLIRKHADVRQVCSSQQSPFLKAAYAGRDNQVSLLLAEGVDVNQFDNEGNTALMYAAKFGHSKLTRVLCLSRADPRLRNKRGMTALQIATKNGESKVANIIRRYYLKASRAHWIGFPDLPKLDDEESTESDVSRALLIQNRVSKRWFVVIRFLANDNIEIIDPVGRLLEVNVQLFDCEMSIDSNRYGDFITLAQIRRLEQLRGPKNVAS